VDDAGLRESAGCGGFDPPDTPLVEERGARMIIIDAEIEDVEGLVANAEMPPVQLEAITGASAGADGGAMPQMRRMAQTMMLSRTLRAAQALCWRDPRPSRSQ